MNIGMNPEVKEGDRIMLYHMDDDPHPIELGTVGTVVSVSYFQPNERIIHVKWDNGRSLNLISSVDAFKKINDPITESIEEFIIENEDIFEHFDWRFFRNYLYVLKDTGVVNMFTASPFLYSGKNHIDRYYGEGREEDENFQELLELAEESKHKLIQGVISFLKSKNKEIEIEEVNKFVRKFSQKLLQLYIVFSEVGRNQS